jgi:proteasome lid subunit RPN8/RPN11
MLDATKKAILDHALRDMPREACGLVLSVGNGKEKYFPCRNMADGTEHFILNPRDYLAAREAGLIVAVVHSHPYRLATPSDADKAACERSGLPWHVVSVPNGIFAYIEPSGYLAPYRGRSWCYGTFDCYSLVRDWYDRELHIALPDFDREGQWWEQGKNLYVERFEGLGFYRIDLDGDWHKDARRGDLLMIQHGALVPNHLAIYLGAGKILHHVANRCSEEISVENWRGYWIKNTTHVLRHRGANG